ncbi:MAG: metabolite traffic protein EboE [Deltaproteobacteria bacterium]
MSLSQLPLSYCTNVHPGRSLAEVEQGLDRYTAALRENYGAPLAAGLWLAAPVAGELLAEAAKLPAFREGLARRRLSCHTLNAFPYGDFHSPRVKENVYLPDWSDRRRLEYTLNCARILTILLAEGVEGSISTVPLAFKGFPHPPDHLDRCADLLLEAATVLDRIHAQTGRLVRLAIEPEPCCLLETTDEAIAFFGRLWGRAGDARQFEIARRHLGLCYDVCHQAVEFEDVPFSIRKLAAAGVRINKVHITCAIELESPRENEAGRRALADYAEERYLHQTFARTRTGAILRQIDLSGRLALDPPPDFRDAEAWRIHFHVPVNAERLGPLRTTRNELRQALETIAGLDYAPHLEVETYTWEVLPGGGAGPITRNLVDGLTAELRATRELLGGLSAK